MCSAIFKHLGDNARAFRSHSPQLASRIPPTRIVTRTRAPRHVWHAHVLLDLVKKVHCRPSFRPPSLCARMCTLCIERRAFGVSVRCGRCGRVAVAMMARGHRRRLGRTARCMILKGIMHAHANHRGTLREKYPTGRAESQPRTS